MYRTPQFQQAHRILTIMRIKNGKPWQDSMRNVKAIAEFLYSDYKIPLPYFMADCAEQIKQLQIQDYKLKGL